MKKIKDRPLLLLGLVYLSGTVFGVCGYCFVLMIVFALLGIFIIDPLKNKKYKIFIARSIVLLAMFFLAAYISYSASMVRKDTKLLIENTPYVTVVGRVYKKEIKNEKYRYYLEGCHFSSEVDNVKQNKLTNEAGWHSCSRVLLYSQEPKACYRLGDCLSIEGQVEAFSEARNEGEFNLNSYYYSQNIDFGLTPNYIEVVKRPKYSIREQIDTLKHWLLTMIREAARDENAGTLSSILLGEKTDLDEEVKKLYQSSGIMHILAISGLHISFIGMGLYKILRKKSCSFLTSMIISLFAVFLYGLMVGESVSTQRAIGMLLLSLMAQIIGRSSDVLNSLGLMLIYILFMNPFVFMYSGFQFSFMAIVGVSFIGEGLGGQRDRDDSKLKIFFSSLGMSLGISLGTLPLVAYYYYEIPTFSFLLNLILLPTMSLVIASGFAGIAVGLLLGAFRKVLWKLSGIIIYKLQFIYKLVGITFMPGRLILWIYELCCRIYLSIPNSILLTGKTDKKTIGIYYLFLFVWVLLMRYENGENQKMIFKRVVIAALGIIICLGIIVYKPSSGFSIDIIDVGQGDGIFCRTDSDVSCFIDGGSTSESGLSTYTIIPFLKANKVRYIDYWFITHGDEDHYNGLMQAVEDGYRVKNIILSKYITRDTSFDKIKELAEKNDIKLLYMSAGDSFFFGETRISCLYPWGNSFNDKNEQSLVLEITNGAFDGLFLGDISMDGEKLLAEKYNLARVNFLKVAHHGSKYSSSDILLEEVKPLVSVISVGKNNFYGHPSEEAMCRIKNSGSKLYMTMNSGQLHIDTAKGGYMVSEFLSQ